MDIAERGRLLASMTCGECQPRLRCHLVVAVMRVFNSAIMYCSMYLLSGAYFPPFKSALRFMLQHILSSVQHFLSKCFALSSLLHIFQGCLNGQDNSCLACRGQKKMQTQDGRDQLRVHDNVSRGTGSQRRTRQPLVDMMNGSQGKKKKSARMCRSAMTTRG